MFSAKFNLNKIAIFMFFLVLACSKKTQQEKPVTGTKPAPEKEVKQEIKIINTATLKKDFLGKPEVVFIDNRPPRLFKQLGHLPKAINLPWFEPGHPTNVMTKELLNKHAKGKTIVFYCTGALRAWHAAKAAVKWGFPPEKIYWYKAGWNDYSK